MVSDKKDILEFSIMNSQIVMNQKSPILNANNDSIFEEPPTQFVTTTFSIKLNKNDKNESSIEFWNRIIIIVDCSQVKLCMFH